ncbi:hypothetical protein JR316_0005218 [Psilocybe cubensis]|uniref:Uncharacterized protein n=1 Tax=Psilocybe cubensis TaxID=181762 RepID=A0ACB8H652_PSICU|nr:hypothetical protein JR316_0005218 [Psilocybe cubensis]KAH9483117.1 hypothetical protein JR316_0005218 [Psilocybe cubensis]
MSQGITQTFGLVRTVAYAVATLFALLELALGAAIINWTETKLVLGGYFSFAALAIATGILTFLTLPVMLFFSRTRKGAIVNLVIIEAIWTFVLWVLWVAVGGSAAGTNFIAACDNNFVVDFYADIGLKTVCGEMKALTAFGFLTWFILLAFNIFLFFLVIRQHMRGNSNVWTGYIAETDFDHEGAGAGSGVVEQKISPTFSPQYPPQSPPAGTPQTQTTSPYPQV